MPDTPLLKRLTEPLRRVLRAALRFGRPPPPPPFSVRPLDPLERALLRLHLQARAPKPPPSEPEPANPLAALQMPPPRPAAADESAGMRADDLPPLRPPLRPPAQPGLSNLH